MGLYLVLSGFDGIKMNVKGNKFSGFDGIVSIMKGISNVEYIRLYLE